jgi:hydrogenase maturation protein HypF
MPLVCRSLHVRGLVQGVGFRPWAARLARELALGGEVRNTGEGVRLRLEGDRAAVERFCAALAAEPPPGARIDAVEVDEQDTGSCRVARAFRVAPSDPRAARTRTSVPPDVPLCEPCLAELFDPGDRRYRHPFAHCAACGPRASVLLGLPFDRERTTLRGFAPCPACRAEYADPQDRRYHAETIACPGCGPKLWARRGDGSPLPGDPIERAAAALAAGGIVALKGYGGYHLLADATSAGAVGELRRRKARPRRPFAILVPDLAQARRLAWLCDADARRLAGPLRGVVIARRRPGGLESLAVVDAVAPSQSDVGLVLPCAPVHWLLLFGPGQAPRRAEPRFRALVLTSANLSGEPTLHDDASACLALAEVADVVIGHDREIAHPSDDSVHRSSSVGSIALRLARGAAPLRLRIPEAWPDVPPLAAIGGDLKCAPAVASGREIWLAPHLGDLASVRAADALLERVRALAALAGIEPALLAHDLHPEYIGTRSALRAGLPLLAVQHHHAHALAALVDHAHPGPALALALDGAGLGADGSLWGAEILLARRDGFERLAHLEPIALPGGEAALREPWRPAAMWLDRAFAGRTAPRLAWHARRRPGEVDVLRRMASRGVNAPVASSCGRLFDAVASLLDVADATHGEGEAAMALESLAADAEAGEAADRTARPAATRGEMGDAGNAGSARAAPRVIVASDLVREVALARAAGEAAGPIARRFHRRLAARWVDAVRREAATTRVGDVLLVGGCFQNRLLLEAVAEGLRAAGLRALPPRELPPNDGALAVGQAARAAGLRAGHGATGGGPRVFHR